MTLINLADAKNPTSATNGLHSISNKKVYFGHPNNLSKELLTVSVPTVCCQEHGAMLAITKWDEGTLWRCPACNEGCIELNELVEVQKR
ncbi:hypothetical protein LCGC14_2051900 [marine sediment metagenome]|uniref:Uncharacterized protein n=1 Tax=marine sediment metagenome TaxID=412755 RepID=A0A0F9HKR0_9ZZZZ